MYSIFIDFKAAFDTVDREMLWKLMHKKGISNYLISCCQEIYRKTPLTLGNNCFYTSKGVKQGCPLSPILFALYISEIDEKLMNAQAGGVTMGRSKVFTLAYADDMVLLASSAKELREMIRITDKFLDGKKLVLNAKKTKVVVFSAAGRLNGAKILWKGEEIEEVKSFNYLGFLFSSNGKHQCHIEKQRTEAMKKMGEVWSIAERRFPERFLIRMKIFDALIKSGLLYGSEVYGWREWERLEVVQRRYIKWTLGLNSGTRNAIVSTETGRLPLHVETIQRALQFEQRARESRNPLLKEAQRSNMTRSEERAQFFSEIGWNERTEQGNPTRGEIAADVYRIRTIRNIRSSLAHTFYESRIPQDLPEYLNDQPNMKIIARLRCGNEERGLQKWRTERERNCRICGTEEETIEHWMTTCHPSQLSEEELWTIKGKSWISELDQVLKIVN